jgi:hypothetical protein
MGMWPDIEPMSRKKLGWSHLIKEDEGTNHLPLVAGQSATDFKAVAQIADSRNHDQFQRITRSLIAKDRIGRGQPTHYELAFLSLLIGLT